MFRVSLFDFFVRNVIIISKAPAARKTACCRAIAEKTGLFYTIHLDENLNVSDFNPHVAQAYRRTVEETVALAKALDAPLLNMHLSRGVYFTLPDRRVYLFFGVPGNVPAEHDRFPAIV